MNEVAILHASGVRMSRAIAILSRFSVYRPQYQLHNPTVVEVPSTAVEANTNPQFGRLPRAHGGLFRSPTSH